MERGRASRGLLPLLAFHTLSEYSRLERKPPVTAGLLAANTLIYLRPAFLKPILPTLDEVAYNPYLILKYMDTKRFFLSPFYHIGDLHLFYNMLSLLWKGVQLETILGSAEFASLVAALLVMSQGITLILSKLLLLFDYPHSYYNEYAVGFSGVLFAMKVILNSQSENYSYVHGLLVPTRFAAWIELIIIQITVPDVSFLGHLGGILAGLLFLQFKKLWGRSYDSAMRMIVKGVSDVVRWPFKLLGGLFGFFRPSFGRGVVGRSRMANEVWRCPACTFDNSYRLTVCEMCGTGRDGTGLSQLVELSPEELRRRRIERFNRR